MVVITPQIAWRERSECQAKEEGHSSNIITTTLCSPFEFRTSPPQTTAHRRHCRWGAIPVSPLTDCLILR
jgi:hypothetical protein